MKIFVDSNIVLDVLEQREPFLEKSQRTLSEMVDKNFKIYISALSVANILYIEKNQKKTEKKYCKQ